MKTLILNSDYRPLSVVDMKRAIVLDIYNKNLTVVSYYDTCILSTNGEKKVPAVMVYCKYVKIAYKRLPSKRAIRARDKNKCGYCGLLLRQGEYTIDHIIPVSRFETRAKANTWENQVCCCRKCNLKKGNKTPEEAGMKLLVNVRSLDRLFPLENIPKEWEFYI